MKKKKNKLKEVSARKNVRRAFLPGAIFFSSSLFDTSAQRAHPSQRYKIVPIFSMIFSQLTIHVRVSLRATHHLRRRRERGKKTRENDPLATTEIVVAQTDRWSGIHGRSYTIERHTTPRTHTQVQTILVNIATYGEQVSHFRVTASNADERPTFART